MVLLLWGVTSPLAAQSYVHASVGSLTLDFDPLPALGVDIEEGLLWGFSAGRSLSSKIALEVQYASASIDVRPQGLEPIEGRLHFLGAGARATIFRAGSLELLASLSPGVLIETNEVTEATRNLAIPLGLDLAILPGGRVRPRLGVRDFLHRCDPPEGFEGLICDEGAWLHHVAISVGVEFEP